jgi:uncharacterized protein YggU (UPF0235/DUF167 family)
LTGIASAPPSPLRPDPDGAGIRIAVRLTPRASRDAVQGIAATASGGSALKVQVTAAPEAGKANDALVRLLAREWRVPRSSLSLAAGATDRNKVLAVAGEPAALGERLGAWLAALDAAGPDKGADKGPDKE